MRPFCRLAFSAIDKVAARSPAGKFAADQVGLQRRPLAPAPSALYETAMPPSFLSHAELDTVIRLAPLIAIDLIIRNAGDEVLLGLRKNEPAKGRYFVPGGMILKGEPLAEAFARLMKNETDRAASLDDAQLLGVFEHFYETNRSGNAGYGTHYVVLGYQYRWPAAVVPKPDDQHSELRWWTVAELLASDRVHENTKAYFRPARREAAAGTMPR